MSIRKKINLKMCRNLIFFFGLIFLTFWLIFKDQDMNELFNVIKSSNKLYIFIGILLMLVYYLIESHNIRCILHSLGEKKISIFKALKFTWIGFFFSAITPAATGGQPVEVYYMTKEKISGPNAALALLIQLCGFQISTISIGVICAILNPHLLKDGLLGFFILGLSINGLALAIMMLCIFSKKTTLKILDVIFKIMAKFNVKGLDIKRKSAEEGIEKYSESAEFIKNNKKEFIKAIARVFVQILVYYSIPFCVYKSFGLSSHNLFQILSMQAVLYTTVSGLPLPGSIGVSESIFLKIFGIAFADNLLNGAMLLSRGITFYLFVVVSLVSVIFNAIRMKNVVGEIDTKVKKVEKEILVVNTERIA